VPSIAVDSGPMVALFNRGDNQHARALRFFGSKHDRLVTNIAVVTEVSHLLNFASGAVRDFIGWVGEATEIDGETPLDIYRIHRIISKYSDLPADFADASLIALCERRKIGHIATFDKDFRILRLANRRLLLNVLDTH
jgi:uncharacterized protein